MVRQYDLLIRNGYVQSMDDVVDIGIADDTIVEIEDTVDGVGVNEIDVDGNLVSASFIDSHMHLDKSFAATGGRFPSFREGPLTMERMADVGHTYLNDTPKQELEDNAARNAKMAARNGTSHIRTHVVINPAWGTKTVEAVAAARDRVSDLVDIEIVPYPEYGMLADESVKYILEESIEKGADLVGAMDPLTIDNNIEDVLNTMFDVATKYDVPIDAHIHEHGTLGTFTLKQLAEKTIEYGHQENVTASHSYALATVSPEERDETIAKLKEAGVHLVTCHTSTMPTMPVDRILENDLKLAHGTDNDCDYVIPHGNADVLEGLFVESIKLFEDPENPIGYQNFDTHNAIDTLWAMGTTEGADIMHLDDHEIAEGSTADLVVFDAPSRQWAVLTETTKTHVIKNGDVIAKEGTLVVD